MTRIKPKCQLNILLYGDIDMNLIDGSAIWLNSLVEVLALEESFHVTLLLKTRIKQDRLVAPLRSLANVTVIDPYQDLSFLVEAGSQRLTADNALKILSHLDQQQLFQCIILRGNELCQKSSENFYQPERIVPYIINFTGIVNSITGEDKKLREMFDRAKVVLVQTEEMKVALAKLLNYELEKICILPPMVPNFPDRIPSFINKNNTLVYAGKFSNDYYVFESLEVFKRLENRGYKFNIAGDKFHLDLKVPKEQLIEMMEQDSRINWAKGLNREDVGELIENSDLGLCWRSSEIDNENSLELSTKLLEYGRLAKPVLLRRIPIHERLLGSDYPFYVNSAEDLEAKIQLAFEDQELYSKAARKVYEVSKEYTFDSALKKIKPHLIKFSS